MWIQLNNGDYEMSSSNSSESGGIGFLGMLTILFVGLKLTGVIGWSWWWVLSPVWIPVSIAAVIIAGLVILKGKK